MTIADYDQQTMIMWGLWLDERINGEWRGQCRDFGTFRIKIYVFYIRTKYVKYIYILYSCVNIVVRNYGLLCERVGTGGRDDEDGSASFHGLCKRIRPRQMFPYMHICRLCKICMCARASAACTKVKSVCVRRVCCICQVNPVRVAVLLLREKGKSNEIYIDEITVNYRR